MWIGRCQLQYCLLVGQKWTEASGLERTRIFCTIHRSTASTAKSDRARFAVWARLAILCKRLSDSRATRESEPGHLWMLSSHKRYFHPVIPPCCFSTLLPDERLTLIFSMSTACEDIVILKQPEAELFTLQFRMPKKAALGP